MQVQWAAKTSPFCAAITQGNNELADSHCECLTYYILYMAVLITQNYIKYLSHDHIALIVCLSSGKLVCFYIVYPSIPFQAY